MNNTKLKQDYRGALVVDNGKDNVDDHNCGHKKIADMNTASLLKKIGYSGSGPRLCRHSKCQLFKHHKTCMYFDNTLNARALDVMYSPYTYVKSGKKHSLCGRADCKGPYHVEMCLYHYDFVMVDDFDVTKCDGDCVGRLHVYGCVNNKQVYNLTGEYMAATLDFDLFQEDLNFSSVVDTDNRGSDCMEHHSTGDGLSSSDDYSEMEKTRIMSDNHVIEAHTQTSAVANIEACSYVRKLDKYKNERHNRSKYTEAFLRLNKILRVMLKNPVRAAIISHYWIDVDKFFCEMESKLNPKTVYPLRVIPTIPVDYYVLPYTVSFLWCGGCEQDDVMFKFDADGWSRFNFQKRYIGVMDKDKDYGFYGVPKRMNSWEFSDRVDYIVNDQSCTSYVITLIGMYLSNKYSLEYVYDKKKACFIRQYFDRSYSCLAKLYDQYVQFIDVVVRTPKFDYDDFKREGSYLFFMSRISIPEDVTLLLERFDRIPRTSIPGATYRQLKMLKNVDIPFDVPELKGVRVCDSKIDTISGVESWLNDHMFLKDGFSFAIPPFSDCTKYAIIISDWLETNHFKFVQVTPYPKSVYMTIVCYREYVDGCISLRLYARDVFKALFKWYVAYIYNCYKESIHWKRLFGDYPVYMSWPKINRLFGYRDAC